MMIKSTPGYRVSSPGKFLMGRKFAYNSNFLRRVTLIDGNPPPTGVVTGPFSATRFRSIDATSSLGMYSPCFSNAPAPAANRSHANCTPVASRIRTTASVTSGPIPSPGISVTACVFPKSLLYQLLATSYQLLAKRPSLKASR